MSFSFNFQVDSEAGTIDWESNNNSKVENNEFAQNSEFGELVISNQPAQVFEYDPISIIEDFSLLKRTLPDIRLQLASEDPLNQGDHSQPVPLDWIDQNDVIQGVYEGGFKTWESSVDLSQYLLKLDPSEFLGKNIIELGCGSSLPSLTILNQFQFGQLHLSDFNLQVLRLVTVPNLIGNLKGRPGILQDFKASEDVDTVMIEYNSSENQDQLSQLGQNQLRCFYGDWNKLGDILQLNPARHVSENPYDMIITSETLYTPAVIHNLYNNLLKLLSYPHGKCYVAAKTVYFGCGGGTLGFKQLIDQDKKLSYKVVYEVEGGVKREILLVQWNN